MTRHWWLILHYTVSPNQMFSRMWKSFPLIYYLQVANHGAKILLSNDFMGKWKKQNKNSLTSKNGMSKCGWAFSPPAVLCVGWCKRASECSHSHQLPPGARGLHSPNSSVTGFWGTSPSRSPLPGWPWSSPGGDGITSSRSFWGLWCPTAITFLTIWCSTRCHDQTLLTWLSAPLKPLIRR